MEADILAGGGKNMGFVFGVEYSSSKGFLHVTRGVEGFYVQGCMVEKVRISSNIQILLKSLVSLRRMELLAKGLR